MGLCGLRALRGLCGFCTRVELGGFRACCVFAPIFIVLHLFFFFFACFPALLVLLPCLVCFCVFVAFVVSFSLSDGTQKERARRVGASSLGVL